jgi:hypothetical protein
VTERKKLIEVALPLEAINRESAREKSIRAGHPSTLHLWWARRPLAACRAVLFSSLVDDPSAHPELFPTEVEQEKERDRLFDLIEKLVLWENSNDSDLLEAARVEIEASCGTSIPMVVDPFSGGGSIPLEAQRLGLRVDASDLNPVAVLIGKALVELPPKFSGRKPVHPDLQPNVNIKSWNGAQGLAEDVRAYAQWMNEEAKSRIGNRLALGANRHMPQSGVSVQNATRQFVCCISQTRRRDLAASRGRPGISISDLLRRERSWLSTRRYREPARHYLPRLPLGCTAHLHTPSCTFWRPRFSAPVHGCRRDSSAHLRRCR